MRSVPTGAYHRLAPIFPFVGLLIAVGLRPAAWVGRSVGRRFGRAALGAWLAALALFAVYGWDNAERALAMVRNEPRSDSVCLTTYSSSEPTGNLSAYLSRPSTRRRISSTLAW